MRSLNLKVLMTHWQWATALWVFISLFRKWNIFSSNQYCDFNFHRKLLKPFLHDRQLPKDYAKYLFDQIWPIFAEIFAKNLKGSPPNSEILCVNQIDRDLKKVENNHFRWGPLQGANIFQIFSVIMFFKKYLEPDLLGKIQLVPQLPLRGHCNLSEIIKTQQNLKGESNMWKKVKLNEQGTPNISSEISLSFENGSESSQFGQILKSELY